MIKFLIKKQHDYGAVMADCKFYKVHLGPSIKDIRKREREGQAEADVHIWFKI